MGFHRFLRGDIFDGDFGSLGKRFCENYQRPSGTYRVSRTFESLAGNFYAHRNPQQHPLSATPLFGGQRPGQSGLRGIWSELSIRSWRFHSSIPQKSMSGASSSIPYSQPSGRGLPFHTTTEALLVPVARLVSDRR